MLATVTIRGTSSSFAVVFAALLLIFCFGFSPAARAQVTYTDPCAGSSSTLNKEFQNAFGQAGMMKTNAAIQALGMYGAIDVKSSYCWAKINQIFQAIQSIGTGVSLNPFAFIVAGIINIIAGQILALINNACSAALMEVQQFKQFLLSQLNHLCIPLPNLQLGLQGLSLGSFANAPPCKSNSVPAFTFGYSAPIGVPGNYRQW